MKIQHWAIIFIIIILPFSIICRNVINKKNLLLRDETRYNNVIDNATYDAVSQIIEVSDELGYGKNIPITKGVADAAIDRFFNTLSVNFNMPIGREKAEAYFSPYIPAIIIVGYDGLYVYSYEETLSGYDFVLKPKIPYSYTVPDTNGVVINFTLDNYVRIYFPSDTFLDDIYDEKGSSKTHVLSGYVGEILDVDNNGIDDEYDGINENNNPYGIPSSTSEAVKYIKGTLPMLTENVSYILEQWNSVPTTSNQTVGKLNWLYERDITTSGRPYVVKQDYEYNDTGDITVYASEFNETRRNTIISLIVSTLRQEFNEHNDFADTVGVTYEFSLPEIGRDQWNNTIDDISVLAFIQGMPIGGDTYYNNYSLGGSRIVQTNYYYAETVSFGATGENHKVYHKEYCPLIEKDSYGNIVYSNGSSAKHLNSTVPETSLSYSLGERYTTGIEQIFVNAEHAKREGYSICRECM